MTHVGSFLHGESKIADPTLRVSALPAMAPRAYAVVIRRQRSPLVFPQSEMIFFARLLFLIAISLDISAYAATQVDINSADARTLAQSLSNVGLVKAEAIVAYRNAHGPFKSLNDLAKVKGIGPRIIEENREVIVFGKPAPAASEHAEPPRPVANW